MTDSHETPPSKTTAEPSYAYGCPDCGGGFNDPVAKRNRDGIAHLHCPFCGYTLDVAVAREANIENCVHPATTDRTDGVEICQNCGVKWDRYGTRIGVKHAWNPAEPND